MTLVVRQAKDGCHFACFFRQRFHLLGSFYCRLDYSSTCLETGATCRWKKTQEASERRMNFSDFSTETSLRWWSVDDSACTKPRGGNDAMQLPLPCQPWSIARCAGIGGCRMSHSIDFRSSVNVICHLTRRPVYLDDSFPGHPTRRTNGHPDVQKLSSLGSNVVRIYKIFTTCAQF